MKPTKSALTLRLLMALVAALFVAGSASAGSIAVYPSYWDTKDAGHAGGLGVNFATPIYKALDFEARVAYYEELKDEPLDEFFSGSSPFETGLKATPLELGLRFNFARNNKVWHPWVGAGGSYYMLDTDAGNIDDEIGFYGTFGSTFGDGQGLDFYADISYRRVKGTVSDLGDLDGDGLDDSFDVNLDGPVANVGIVWKW